MCRRFIPIDCDEVARIAAEIERDLAAHADELASLDPIEAYEDFLFFPESAQPDRAEQRAKRPPGHSPYIRSQAVHPANRTPA